MRTIKAIKVSGTNFTTVGAYLRSHVWINKDNIFTFSHCFVANELLQLVEAPAVEPSVQPLAHIFIPISYSFKVLQYNSVSRSNNLLADLVINPAHIAFLPSRDSLKLSSSRLCAFTLKFFPQELILHNFGFMTCENLTIGSDSKVIYSEVHAQMLVLAARVPSDLSRECDVEEQSTFSVFNNFKSLVSPIKVFPVIFRNIDRNILPLAFSECGNPNLVKGKCKQIPVKTDRAGFHNWFFLKLNRFKVQRSLCNRFTCKVSRKPLPQIFVNKMVQLESVANLSLKSFVNGVLDSFKKGARHIKQVLIAVNFKLYCGNKPHNNTKQQPIYISYGRRCPVGCGIIEWK